MTDLDILTEVYAVLKEYIPTKDRQAAADHLFGNIVDFGLSESDLKKFGASDSYLKRAMAEYMDDSDDDESDDYDDGYDD